MIATHQKQTCLTQCKQDFPILQQTNRGKPLVYLDSASSTQKPRQVIEAIAQFYQHDYANIHRGIYELSERASALYEGVREQVRQFIHAPSKDDIVFVRGTTEAINLIAQSYGRTQWQAGDEVIVSVLEHHSNIVPWLLLKEQIGIELKVIPLTAEGQLDLERYQTLLSPRTKLVAISHASNVLGTINPIKAIVAAAHARQIPVLVDGAQAVPHLPVDVQDLDCDFYVFSAHKCYGPSAGVLYGKAALLAAMSPYHGGGSMIETVSFAGATFLPAPHKFEAGTPDIAGVIGMGAALRYLQTIGMSHIVAHDQDLVAYARTQLRSIANVIVLGGDHPNVGVLSLVVDGIHPHDVGTILDHEGIAVRAGHHCAMPLMQYLNVPATVRASFGVYTTKEDIDALIVALQLAKRLFA